MSGLQETFYIMGIVFMGLIFVMLIVLVSSVLVIRSKINKIHHDIEDRVNQLTSLAEKSGEISAIAGSAMLKTAKRAMKKKK